MWAVINAIWVKTWRGLFYLIFLSVYSISVHQRRDNNKTLRFCRWKNDWTQEQKLQEIIISESWDDRQNNQNDNESTIFRHTHHIQTYYQLKPTNWTVHCLGRVYSTGSACVDYVFRWGYPHLYNPRLVSGGEALRGSVDKTDIPWNIIGTTPGTCLGTTPWTCLGTTPELEFGHCAASGGSTPTSFAVATIF